MEGGGGGREGGEDIGGGSEGTLILTIGGMD